MMNVFFVINGKAVTPSLEEGTILNGVTRNTVSTILKEMGVEVEERRISIDELLEAYKKGQLQEVFGTGTAATISMIEKLKYKDQVMDFDVNNFKLSTEVKSRLNAIREGKAPDTHGWMFEI
jgi:branched-chain amino acid aminotransferase